jgi:glycosyltransferase involved in cell wall biosynthesis
MVSSGPDPVCLPSGPRTPRKILFASAHCIVDSSNGAAVATLDALEGLSAAGFECQAFCSSKVDFPQDVDFEKILDHLGEPYQVRPSASGAVRARILSTRRRQVPVTIVRLESTRQVAPPADEIRAVLSFFRKFLESERPDVMLTYGGDAVTLGMIAMAKRRGVPVVFAIHNFSYTGLEPFRGVDFCVVPSEFASRYYREQLGLDCRVLPNPVDWDRVRVDDHQPRFVTFVNPSPEKGAYPFVRIAHELGRRRPEIPLLVVEGRGTQQVLAACGLEASSCGDVQIMANTADPRRFWRRTRIVLMPSLCQETQGLVAVEAMINGIPVIGSDRGSLPETLGEGALILPLPERLTPTTRVVPTAEEVEPWVETIIRLWDDRAFYEEQSLRGRREARRWHPDRLRPLYAEFFNEVQLQAGPPVVGGEVANGAGLSSGAEDLAGASLEVVTPPSPGLRPPSPRRGEGSADPSPGLRPPSPRRGEGSADSSSGLRAGASQRSEGIPGGLASIIVPCFSQRGFTQLCLKALYRHTRNPWELIVVDNGSTDDTAGYLAGVQDISPVPVTVIANTTNRGFPAAINQGLQAARGDYLVLLNNDAVVTDGWLEQLIALASAPVGLNGEDAGGSVERRTEPISLPGPGGPVPTQGIGLVGPMSNYAAPPQLVEDVPYRDLDQMHAFARRWRRPASREVVPGGQVVGVLRPDEARRVRDDRRAG